MQKKKWFVSYVIRQDEKEHQTSHGFFEGGDVEEALEQYIFSIKELMNLKTSEITVLSVSLV